MQIQNEKLHSAMSAYVSAAVEFVTERAKQSSHPSDSDDLDFYWDHIRYSNDLSEVPQYESCFRELACDKKISKQLNQNVGSYSRGSHTPSIEMMMNRVLDLGRGEGSHEFDPSRFEKEYLLFEESFYSEVLLWKAIAPLQGLFLDVPAISLSPDTEVSRIEEEEMKPYRSQRSHWDNRWCAVRVKYQLTKVIGGDRGLDRLPEIEKERAIEEKANEKIEDVVNALRLMGKCDVYHSGIIHKTSKWLSIQRHSVANRVLGTGFITYPFDERDAHLMKWLWEKLESPMVKGELGVAIRRFGDSCVRHRNEDKLIDLMIAAESLFLRGTKEGEKSFRLALRAAQFLGDGAANRQIYDRMRLAYYCRSVLVHGGTPSSDRKLKKLDLMKFAGEVADDIQAAIFKALSLLGTTETDRSLTDDYWARYLFGPTNEK